MKVEIGSALRLRDERRRGTEVAGRDLVTGLLGRVALAPGRACYFFVLAWGGHGVWFGFFGPPYGWPHCLPFEY